MWRKKKKEEKKEKSLLKELCGDDAELYDFLSIYLYVNPFTVISQKDLDTLTEEADKSGNYGSAMDKALFEASQNPEERGKYIQIIQNLASKTLHAAEQEKEEAEKQGITDLIASLGRRIENQKFMRERTEDIINVASEFYNEKLVELGENIKRAARGAEQKEAAREENRLQELERAGREARKKEEEGMGRKERKEAEKQDKREALAAEARKGARAEESKEAEREEMRIREREKEEREARKKERAEN